jgi:asparagine synthase (glutamine-hydrolysing)
MRNNRLVASAVRCAPTLDVKYYRSLNKDAYWLTRSIDDEIVTAMQFVREPILNAIFPGTDTIERTEAARRETLSKIHTRDALTRAQLFDLTTYLPALLVRQDKMSMAASIENRVPFITPRMARLGLSLPRGLRATWTGQKVLLKRLFANYVPKPIAYRKKAGFAIPITQWLQQRHGRERLQCLGTPSALLLDYMDREAIADLVANFRGGESEAEALWVLVTLSVWLRIFGSKARFAAGYLDLPHTAPVAAARSVGGMTSLQPQPEVP